MFKILNPYNHNGIYRKAQLHLHTSKSIDVLNKIPVAETLTRYQQAGYTFVVITDHDRVTKCPLLSTDDFLIIPGVEETITSIFWPLGKHILRIGACIEKKRTTINERIQSTLAQGGLMAPAHPNWPGNFGTGRWGISDLQKLNTFQLLEIFNRHSPCKSDLCLWHRILKERGYQKPVWGIAVDDTDNGEPLDLGWVMVKTSEVSTEAFLNSLRNGCFYATNGPDADFRVEASLINTSTKHGNEIRFIDSQNRVIAAFQGNSGSYQPNSSEQFVRVEISDQSGRTAWSQPFFIVPE